MKEQFNINSLRREVSTMNKVKTKISKIWFVWFFAACATSSIALVYIFWHSNVFRDAILAQLELKNGSQTFSWWVKPPVRPLLKVKIFNYTNVDEYMNGKASKLHVQEVGPYIYRETITKENLQFNDNGTITYREHVTHDWEGGSPDNEIIKAPNVPLMVAFKMLPPAFYGVDLLRTKVTEYALQKVNITQYKTLTAKDYLWGYTDNLVGPAVELSKLSNIFATIKSLPYTEFGMLLSVS